MSRAGGAILALAISAVALAGFVAMVVHHVATQDEELRIVIKGPKPIGMPHHELYQRMNRPIKPGSSKCYPVTPACMV